MAACGSTDVKAEHVERTCGSNYADGWLKVDVGRAHVRALSAHAEFAATVREFSAAGSARALSSARTSSTRAMLIFALANNRKGSRRGTN